MTFAEQIAASEDPVALVCAQSLLTDEEKQTLQTFRSFIEKRDDLLKDRINTEKKISKLETEFLRLKAKAEAQEEQLKTTEKIARANAKLDKIRKELQDITEERKRLNPYSNGEKQIPVYIAKARPENYLFRMRKNQDNTRYLIALQNFLFETGDNYSFTGSYNVFFARLLDVSYPEYLLICEAMGADMQSPVGYTYPSFDKAEDGYHIAYALTNRWNAIKDYFKPYEEEFPDEYDRTEDVDNDDTGESEV